MHVAFAGKGASGKSSLVALAAAWLARERAGLRTLLVDADPHQTLTGLLGARPALTVAQARERFLPLLLGQVVTDDSVERRQDAAERVLATRALADIGPARFLAIGRWDAPGSQCVPNRVLGMALAALIPQFDLTLVDHEAGVEHLGRFSELPLDRLLVTATPDARSLDVAAAVLAHARAVGRVVRSAALVLNRVTDEDRDDPAISARLDALAAAGLPCVAALPESAGLRACARRGGSPTALDAADPWLRAVHALLPAVLPRADGRLPALPPTVDLASDARSHLANEDFA